MNEAMSHLRQLSVEIGPRPAGSPAQHRAADYIRAVFLAAGLEVETQEYACPAWEHVATHLHLAGQPLEATANPFSRPCDVTAALVAVGTLPELEVAELQGCIGVLYGDLTADQIAPKSWFLKGERDERIVALLEAKRPAALSTVQSVVGNVDAPIEDDELDIPSASVGPGAGRALLAAAGAIAHLRIESRRSPGRSCNVVGRTPGRHDAWVVCCAHHDTKHGTPGAWDNGSGVAVLLTLARRLGSHARSFGLEYVAFSGEESLPIGDDEYVRRGGERFGQIIAALNFDGVGAALGSNSITAMSESAACHHAVTECSMHYPGVVWVDPWPQSNHSTFAMRGVPSLAFTSRGAPHLAHLRSDTIDWISPTKLAELVALAGDIVELLNRKTPAWTRP